MLESIMNFMSTESFKIFLIYAFFAITQISSLLIIYTTNNKLTKCFIGIITTLIIIGMTFQNDFALKIMGLVHLVIWTIIIIIKIPNRRYNQ